MLAPPAPGRRARRRAPGFALVDVCMSLLVLVVAMGVLLGSVFSALRLSQVNESTAAASQALRSMVETMNAMPLEEVLASYNEDASDDPNPRITREDRLRVRELKGDAEQALVAEVSFPLDSAHELREDLVAPELGMPRDLDGDGKIEAAVKPADLRVLPVTLELDWHGPSGPQVIRYTTLLRGRG